MKHVPKSLRVKLRLVRLAAVVAVFTALGGVIIYAVHADTYATSLEAEKGSRQGIATQCGDSTASANVATKFGTTSCITTPIAAGQLVGWNSQLNGPGGAWHRLLQLPDGSWLRVLTVFPANGRSELNIYRSTDHARTWTYLADINDGNRLVDNGFLYLAPNGDILASGRNLINGASYKISQWRSSDAGKTWKRESEIKSSGRGLWEPFYFTVSNNRTLVIWCDESYGGYSQVMVAKLSSDSGKTWGNEFMVAADGVAGRPGMPSVAKLANGRYVMVMEVCATRNCNVYYKTSADGASWGTNVGTAIAGEQCGPYITTLTNGRTVVTACRTSDASHATPIKFSEDNAATWKYNAPSYADAGTFGNWPAIYQIGPDEMAAVSGATIRFGTIPR